MLSCLSLLALWLVTSVRAQTAGSIVEVGDTQVSAMMMFLGNQQKIYILDKSEGNAANINGHPAWGSVWDIASNSAQIMDIYSNTFCSSGMHLPNGSFTTFGGNGAIAPGGNAGSVVEPGAGRSSYDATYQDYDGTKAIRILNPCTGSNADLVANSECGWWEDANVLEMQRARWYSTAEPLGDGTIVIIGGFVNGGYINRNYPNDDPAYSHGAAEPTYEFYPSKGQPQVFQFMVQTSGLNSYPHSFLMPSGKMFVQANVSTVLWDPIANTETPFPDMPGNVVRVYPGSGAAAMLPLTPANNYNPTILFCGGNDLPDEAWGNYSWPYVNTWEYPASSDCQRITPEPEDGSTPTYEQDDDMFESRTMGQFISLPNGKLLVLNGGSNGTAGYSTMTLLTLSYSDMPYGMSLASGPVGRPSIYDPEAPQGSRWSSDGLSTSKIPRLYHSSAMLLPDASVLIAGSNPNVDVNTSTYFPTTYQAEIFYPPYFSASNRPVPTGIPTTLSYGGDYFDITIPASSYSGSANAAADSTMIMVIRPGFTTHGMNMGQRSLQLNNTYTVDSNGSIVYHVSQMPPNANIFQPGPAFLFVTINGIPSNGTYLTVGSGNIETQSLEAVGSLPPNVRMDSASGSGRNNSSNGGSSSLSIGIVGAIIGGVVVVAVLGGLFGICLARRRRAASQGQTTGPYSQASLGTGRPGSEEFSGKRNSDSSAFIPLQPSNLMNQHWDASSVNLVSPSAPYFDNRSTRSGEFDPYYERPLRMSTSAGPPRY